MPRNPYAFSKHPAHLKAERQREYRRREREKTPVERIVDVLASLEPDERKEALELVHACVCVDCGAIPADCDC